MSNVSITGSGTNLGNQMVAASVTYPDEVAFNKNAYGEGTAVQAHHLIPKSVAKDYESFFKEIASGYSLWLIRLCRRMTVFRSWIR